MDATPGDLQRRVTRPPGSGRAVTMLGYLSLADYENTTLAQDGASLAASRLSHSHSMIKEKAA